MTEEPTCYCGHEADEHDDEDFLCPCTVEDCGCPCYDPEVED